MVDVVAKAVPDWLPFAGFWLLILGLMMVEVFLPIHRDPKEGKGRLLSNFSLGAVNACLFFVLPLSTVASALWARGEGWGVMNQVILPAALAFVATILIRSLAAYLLHVLVHKLPWLWRMHRIHHCDTAVDLSTGFRHHPFELLFVAGCHSALAIVFGLSVEALMAYEAAAVSFSLWSHVNFRIPDRFEAGLRLMFVTPAMHHVHHSARQAETDSNYGELFSFWDRIFGTHRHLAVEELQAARLGLGTDHDEHAANFLRQLRSPFVPDIGSIRYQAADEPKPL